MSILQMNLGYTGTQHINPRRNQLVTTDSLSTIQQAGYLKGDIRSTDIFDVVYSFSRSTASGSYGEFTVSIDVNNAITLVPAAVVGGVSVSGSPLMSHIAVFTSANTISTDPATAFTNGNLQAGGAGVAGYLASIPPTASTGQLRIAAASNAGNTVTTITNASMGQATTLTIPDPLTGAGKILVATSLAGNNLVKANGTSGILQDAGFAVHAGTTAAFGGGGVTNTFTATGVTASSIVTANIVTQTTGAATITKLVPGTNQIVVTFGADPGAATTLNWISISAAV